jgi:hypothetical protein
VVLVMQPLGDRSPQCVVLEGNLRVGGDERGDRTAFWAQWFQQPPDPLGLGLLKHWSLWPRSAFLGSWGCFVASLLFPGVGRQWSMASTTLTSLTCPYPEVVKMFLTASCARGTFLRILL